MTTLSFVVGLDPILFYNKQKDVFIDVIIQNLSAVALYFGEDQGVNALNGLRINANGVLEIKDFQGSIWLVSVGAVSDIRIWMQSFKLSNREREV